MKNWRLGLGLGLLSLFLSPRSVGEPLPPHPTLLQVEYQGAPHPVIAVEKEEPVILIDGKRKRIRGNVPITTARLPRFSGARAEMDSVRVEVVQLVTARSESEVEQVKNNRGATVGGYVEFTATVAAEQDLSDCYVALVAFDKNFLVGATDRPNAQIRVRQIPNLRAHQATPIKFSSTPFLSSNDMKVFALLFSAGDEVATNHASDAKAYFTRRERVIHAAAVKQWLLENAHGSKPPQPILQIPPAFKTTEGFPPEVTADLTVGADGTVLHVGLNRTLPPAAEDMVTRSLGAWLFLPKLTDGKPSLTHVAVPLRF